MRRLFPAAVLFAAAVAAVGQQPQAQYPQPRIQSIFPMGAKAGTPTDVTVLGTDVDDATALVFSHPGISASVSQPPADAGGSPADKKKEMPKPAKKAAPTEAKF